MNVLLLCAAIELNIVLVWDLFDAPNRILSTFFRLPMTLNPPFGCSLCMTFWVTLLVLLTEQPSLWWCAVLFAWTTRYVGYALKLIDRGLTTLAIIIERALTNK